MLLCLAFEELGILSAKLRHFGSNYHPAVGLLRVIGEVVAVIVLSGIEICQRADFCDNGRIPPLGCFLAHALSNISLFFAVIEDHRTILGPDIFTLAVRRSGIVSAEKHLHQLFITDHGRVERDAHHLRVAGGIRAHLLVGRIRYMSAGIAGLSADYAFEAAKDSLGTQNPLPKVACSVCMQFTLTVKISEN